MTRGPLTLEVLNNAKGLDTIAPSWSHLLVESSDRSPFLSWEWVRTWWEHFGDQDRLRVIVVRDGEEPVAIAPLLEHRLGVGPADARLLVGIGQETADYGGFLLGSHPAETAPMIFAELARHTRRGLSTVNLTRLRDDGDTLQQARTWLASPEGRASGLELHCIDQEDYPYRGVGPGSDPLGPLLKRNDVRRRLRRLSESHEVDFEFHAEGQSERAVAEFLLLHDRRWQDKTGEPTGLFTSPRGRAFIVAASSALDRAGWLRISFLRADGKPIVARFGTEFEGTYAGMKSGWDPAFARYGPGHLIVGAILQELEDHGAREFDFMRGAGAHKDQWADASRSIGYWHLVPKGWRSRPATLTARLLTRRRYRSRFA